MIRQVIINIDNTNFIFQIFRNKCKKINIRIQFNTDIQIMTLNMFRHLLTSIIEASPHKKIVCPLLQSGTNSQVMKLSLHDLLSIFFVNQQCQDQESIGQVGSFLQTQHHNLLSCLMFLVADRLEVKNLNIFLANIFHPTQGIIQMTQK